MRSTVQVLPSHIPTCMSAITATCLPSKEAGKVGNLDLVRLLVDKVRFSQTPDEEEAQKCKKDEEKSFSSFHPNSAVKTDEEK